MYRRALAGIGIGLGLFEAGGFILDRVMRPEPKEVELQDTVSIHLCTLNEEDFIVNTLESVIRQPLFQEADINLYVLDSYSTDNTADVAGVYADEVWLVPRGKLTARNYGYEKDDADIIVSIDAGDFYPEGWLSSLLEPFQEEEVIASHGSTLSEDLIWAAPQAWFNLIRPFYSITGRNMALQREAYFATGGFNLEINELDRDHMVLEEEIIFLERLKEVGRVAFVRKAAVIANMRHMPVTFMDGRVPNYKREIEGGVRF